MNIGKFGRGGALMSDTCNGERKTHRLIAEKVHEAAEDLRKDDSDDIRILEVDYWNYLRNVWLGDMTNSLFTLLGNTMR